jgi:pilus assembly protein FimV
MAHCLPRFLTTVLLTFAGAGALAAELGDARVASYAGQQLVADIELTALENPAAPVQVRLAHPDVYRGANIAMPPVLSSLNMTVMQRDGKQFLHLTSLKPVDADHLHLYLELVDGAHRAVRLSTLWLSPDPNPVPVASAAAPVREEAVPARPPLAVAEPPARPRVPAAEPSPARPRVPAREPVPAPQPPAPAPTRARAEPLQPQAQRLPARFTSPVAASHLPVAANPMPAACTPQPNEQAKACIALDAKNVALRAQLVQLEQKVKVMQVSLQGSQGAAAAPAPAEKLPAGPAPILPRKPKKHAEPTPGPAGFPWLAAGIGTAVLLALAGAAAWFVRWRRLQLPLASSPRVSRDGIKSRLMGGP